MDGDRFHLFLLLLFSDGTRINVNEYLSSLEDGTELLPAQKNKCKNGRSFLN